MLQQNPQLAQIDAVHAVPLLREIGRAYAQEHVNRASIIAAGNLDLVLQSEVEAPSRKEPCPGAVLSPKRKAREDRRPATRQNTPPHPWQLTDRGVRGVGDTSGRFRTGTNYKCSWRKESGWFRAIGAA